MKLTDEQKKALLEVYLKSKADGALVETDTAEIKARAKTKRANYLRNKKIIDQVFYHEMART